MVRQPHRIAAALALTLALAATVAPTAWADPPPLAHMESAIAANHGQSSTWVVRPNPDQQVIANASPQSSGPCSEVCSSDGHGYPGASQSFATPNDAGATLPHNPLPRPLSNANPTSTTPTAIVRSTSDGGFDWGDAAIGAGAAVILLAVGVAGAWAATSSRKRHTLMQRPTASH